jgi:hypothetical protein
MNLTFIDFDEGLSLLHGVYAAMPEEDMTPEDGISDHQPCRGSLIPCCYGVWLKKDGRG